MEAIKTSEKTGYGIWRSTVYMLNAAWRGRKQVIALCVLEGILAFAVSLTELYFTPTVLGFVETRAPLERLLGGIVFFALVLLLIRSARSYVKSLTLGGRISVRVMLMNDANIKLARMAYPLSESESVRKKYEKAYDALAGNSSAAEAIWETLRELLSAVLGFIVYIALLSNVSPVLMAVVTVTAAASYFSSKRLNSWGYRHREEVAGYEHKGYYIYKKAQDYTLAKDVRLFGISAWLMDVYNSVYRLYRDFHARAARVYIIADVIDAFFALMRNGAVYFFLISMTLRGELTAAEFLLYFTAASGFTSFVLAILNCIFSLHQKSLDISALREYMDIAEPFKFEDGEPLEPVSGAEYELTLKNVSYRYEGATGYALKNVDLTIKPGEKLAIVGLNGAGKTTLVKLVTGLYDPTEGEVLLNGVDIRRYNRRDYYRHFSAVFQDFSVLAASVLENIAQCPAKELTKDDMARLEKCVERAGLKAKLLALADGYSTKLGKQVYDEAVELSGGETQRLMLARALYKNAPVIVLDEPTAALDPISESDLYKRYGELTGGRTSLYISHRLASTRFCDRIILLQDGEIMEEGTHDALLALNGVYAGLFEIQSRYYKQEGAEHE